LTGLQDLRDEDFLFFPKASCYPVILSKNLVGLAVHEFADEPEISTELLWAYTDDNPHAVGF
jgi:hypothetical protein